MAFSRNTTALPLNRAAANSEGEVRIAMLLFRRLQHFAFKRDHQFALHQLHGNRLD